MSMVRPKQSSWGLRLEKQIYFALCSQPCAFDHLPFSSLTVECRWIRHIIQASWIKRMYALVIIFTFGPVLWAQLFFCSRFFSPNLFYLCFHIIKSLEVRITWFLWYEKINEACMIVSVLNIRTTTSIQHCKCENCVCTSLLTVLFNQLKYWFWSTKPQLSVSCCF